MRFLAEPRLIRVATILFWIALVLAVVMAVLPKPPQTPIDRFGDKFAHMLAFATLAGLAAVAFGKEARWRIFAWLCFLGAAIEVVQSIPALHRSADVRDWIVDTVAIAVTLLLAGWIVPDRDLAG